MVWKKKRLTLRERLTSLKDGIEWLVIFNIPSYNPDEKRWRMIRTSWIERWDCFLGGIETAIIGYVYESDRDDGL